VNDVQATRAKEQQVRGPVMRWFEMHPGIVKNMVDVAEELKLNPNSCFSAAAALAKAGILEKGPLQGTYAYRGARPNDGRLGVGVMLEVIGYNPGGMLIVKDERGTLHIFKES
jgi:hypothetical protein